MTVTLIADDLTGACDAAAVFTGRGRVGVFLEPFAIDCGWDVVALDTGSRGLTPAESRERVRAAARSVKDRLSAGSVFKKIDSTLRGLVGDEVEALLEETGLPTAVVCPALPGEGRTVTRGLLYVHGSPAHASAIGRDPAYPGSTSDVGVILGRSVRRPVTHVALDAVRRGHRVVAALLSDAAGHIVAADAETDADLEIIAAAALATPGVITAGSAGLARAVSAQLGHAGLAVVPPAGRAWLIVAGSLHPATRAQLRALRDAGVRGAVVDETGRLDREALAAELERGRPVYLATPETETPSRDARARMAAALGAAAAEMCRTSRPDVVAVTGGETAHALLRALGAGSLEVRGAPATGLALCDLGPGAGPALTCLTKAGGFGAPDCFLALIGGRR